MDVKVISIDENTWRFEEQGVRYFLLTGQKRAMVVDTGMMSKNVKQIVESLTTLETFVVNTHADMDHIACNSQFDEIYMHPSELVNYKKFALPIYEGDIIDLGNRKIKVIHIPGHTPGSIGLIDIEKRFLISGDPIQDGKIFMFGTFRNMLAYKYGLERLKKFDDEYDIIYPSHGSFPIQKDIIPSLIEGANKILNHELTFKEVSFHNIPLCEYDVGVAKFLCDKG